MEKYNGGPAFPIPQLQSHSADFMGMTLRDYFSVHAPVTIDDAISACGFGGFKLVNLSEDQVRMAFRRLAYLQGIYAEEKLAERLK